MLLLGLEGVGVYVFCLLDPLHNFLVSIVKVLSILQIQPYLYLVDCWLALQADTLLYLIADPALHGAVNFPALLKIVIGVLATAIILFH